MKDKIKDFEVSAKKYNKSHSDAAHEDAKIIMETINDAELKKKQKEYIENKFKQGIKKKFNKKPAKIEIEESDEDSQASTEESKESNPSTPLPTKPSNSLTVPEIHFRSGYSLHFTFKLPDKLENSVEKQALLILATLYGYMK